MIRQCAILFGCLALGELIVFLTGIKLPSSIIGMLLLTLFLKLGWIKLHWVQGMSDFLVANLGFFFIPPGVALMLYFDIIAAEFKTCRRCVGGSFVSAIGDYQETIAAYPAFTIGRMYCRGYFRSPDSKTDGSLR